VSLSDSVGRQLLEKPSVLVGIADALSLPPLGDGRALFGLGTYTGNGLALLMSRITMKYLAELAGSNPCLVRRYARELWKMLADDREMPAS
jgi:hypothetical protein